MGGNALKNCETRRYEANEYFVLEHEILTQLRKDFPSRQIEAIKAYRTKTSFGDADILFQSDTLAVNILDYLKNTFKSQEVFKNGNVYSFEYRQFQIDLILTPLENFETSVNYFAWNDLGNFLGRIAHKLGFSLGHTGLRMYYKDGDYQFAEITVSKDFAQILRFLGFDPVRYFAGFDTMEDVYAFAATTPYFNKDIFLYENRNHVGRVRDKKRKSYREFLAWLETQTQLTAYPWAVLKEQGGPQYKQEFVARAFEFFPEFKVIHEKTLADFALWKEAKAKFNGELVAEWTGLTGKELGAVMKKFKELFATKEDMQQHILQVTATQLKQEVCSVQQELASA